VDKARIKIFSGSANHSLAEEIADYIGIPLGEAEVGRFSDGEIQNRYSRERPWGKRISESNHFVTRLMKPHYGAAHINRCT